MGNFYNYLVAFASAMGGFLFGYEIGIIDQIFTMDSFGLQFGMKYRNSSGTFVPTAESADISGWITFTFLLGCVVGAAGSWVLADSIGRRFSILVGSVLFTVGGAMQTGAGAIGVLYAGRIISGVGVGLMSAVVPMYISETAAADVRGRLISIYQLMITFGILVASAVNAVILSTVSGDFEWRLAMGIQIIPACILWGLIVVLPFSPRWLVDKNRDKEALHVLARLRNHDEASAVVQDEFAAIKQSSDFEKTIGSVSWLELRKPGIRNRMWIGGMLQLFQQWTGINVVMYYAAILFAAMGFSYVDSSVTFVLVNSAVNFLGTFPGMWLIEKIGRRKLMIIGGCVMGMAHFCICLFVGLSVKVPQLAWLAVIAVYIFTVAFASTWGPVVWVYQAEIFPMRCRAKGNAFCTVINWVWNAVIAKITPLILANIGFYTYLIFGVMGILMAVFVNAFVPETRGRSLEDMDFIFGKVATKPLSNGTDSLKLKKVLH